MVVSSPKGDPPCHTEDTTSPLFGSFTQVDLGLRSGVSRRIELFYSLELAADPAGPDGDVFRS